MATDGLSDEQVSQVLRNTHRIALVGASEKPWRPSHGVMRFLLAHGFEVTPVNPNCVGRSIHGRTVMGTLAEAAPLEMVDLFRRPEYVGEAVEAAIALGARVIWMQLGVINHQAAKRARAAGLVVVMDRCPAIEWPRLGLDLGLDLGLGLA